MLLIGRPLLRALQPQKPLRGCRIDEVYTSGQVGQSVCAGMHERIHICVHIQWHYVMILCTVWVYKWVRLDSSDHPSLRPGVGCCTAQVNFSGQAPLSGSPMWFHLDRQGLQLQSADSLSGHRAGAVKGRPHWLGYAAGSITHIMAHTSLLATGASWSLWSLCRLTATGGCVTAHWSLLGFLANLGW